jgi:YgiT-type zinc finger domain-containing protein
MEKRLQEPPMICLICRKADILDGFMSIDFERDEFNAVIHLVPAEICPACGESYLHEAVVSHLLDQVEGFSREGMNDIIQDYA